jgi:hypothetical protein
VQTNRVDRNETRPRPVHETKKPAGISSCEPYDCCDDDTLPVICPTYQILSKMSETKFGKLKPAPQVAALKRKARYRFRGAGCKLIPMMPICR